MDTWDWHIKRIVYAIFGVFAAYMCKLFFRDDSMIVLSLIWLIICVVLAVISNLRYMGYWPKRKGKNKEENNAGH